MYCYSTTSHVEIKSSAVYSNLLVRIFVVEIGQDRPIQDGRVAMPCGRVDVLSSTMHHAFRIFGMIFFNTSATGLEARSRRANTCIIIICPYRGANACID